MEKDTEQTGGGGLMDELTSRGRDAASQAMNDPGTQDQVAGLARERFGNVPGFDQAAQGLGIGGGAAREGNAGNDPTGEYDGAASTMDDGQTDGIGSSGEG